MTEGSELKLDAASDGDDPRVRRGKERLGRVIGGRWTLKELIGVGGSATVYAAVHRNGRRVALKVLHEELAMQPSIRKRFLSEGYVANKVEHPGVVPVLDDGEDGELVFLVMELFVGQSLADQLLKTGPMEAAAVVKAARAVLEVLAVAHDRGVVHRDIKPSNVFVTDGGDVKVLDFGVARFREASDAPVTQSGYTVGTPAFMAPEQAGGRVEEISALTDIWAVGATMFQLLTGRLVHVTGSSNAAIVAAATTPAMPVRQVRPSIPSEVAKIVDRALAYRPDDRFPDARAMSAALAATASGRGVAPMPAGDTLTVPEAYVGPTPASASPAKGPPTASVRAGVALVLLSGIGLGLYLASRASGEKPAVDAGPSVATVLEPTATPPIQREPAGSAVSPSAAGTATPAAGPKAPAALTTAKTADRPRPITSAPPRRGPSEDEVMDRRK